MCRVGAVLGATLCLLAISAGQSWASADSCTTAPTVHDPVSVEEVHATLSCYESFDVGLSSQVTAMSSVASACPNYSTSDMATLGSALRPIAVSSLERVQKTAKAKVAYFRGKKALYDRRGETVTGARLGNVATRVADANTAVVAVWTDFENVAAAMSSDDCEGLTTLSGTTTADWETENDADNGLAATIAILLGRSPAHP
jgi:hypothetical protein